MANECINRNVIRRSHLRHRPRSISCWKILGLLGVSVIAFLTACTGFVLFFLGSSFSTILSATSSNVSFSVSSPPSLYKNIGRQYMFGNKTVVVGTQGEAVQQAILHRLPQRNKGRPRELWDVIEDRTCISRRRHDQNPTTTAITARSIRAKFLPEAILIGVQKGGTTALSDYLHQHPSVAKVKKELYFLDEVVDKVLIDRSYNFDANTNNSTSSSGVRGIPQQVIQNMYGKIIKNSWHNNYQRRGDTYNDDNDNGNDSNNNKMVLDMTPNYMFQSDRIPQRISCIVPWAKIMVLLRNPIDRARSQYDMKVRFVDPSKRRNVPSFASYIQADISALQETGVLQDWSVVDFDSFFHSSAMQEAWRTYLNSGLNAPVGMGLYALQILPFLEVIPKHNILAIRSEDLQSKTDETFTRVLDFLGLPPFTFTRNQPSNKGQVTVIDTMTGELLKNVFEPFNRKLGELLGDLPGDERFEVWET